MDQHFATRKCPFLGSLGRRVQWGQAAALYCRVSTADQTCARQERDLRAFAKKAGYKVVGVWKEIASGAKQERAERKKVLALAQARTVDLILVTELTRWGRSARFAARSLTCFKFRFVSSPLLGRKLLITLAPQNDKCVVVTVRGPRTGRYFAKLDELPVTRIFDAKTQVIANRRRHI